MKIDQPQFAFILSMQQSEKLAQINGAGVSVNIFEVEEIEQLKAMMKDYSERLPDCCYAITLVF